MDRGARSREELLDAAERLIAEHGFEVPLREIAKAAGQRNNSAVNYYFRSRQDLIDAVVARRLVPMEVERQALLDCMSDEQMADAHAVLRILVGPFFHSEGTHYARFLEVVRIRLNREPQSPAESAWPRILDALARLVPLKDRNARERRVGAVATTMFALLADHERRVEAGEGPRGQERSDSGDEGPRGQERSDSGDEGPRGQERSDSGDESAADSLEEIVTMLAAMLTAAPVAAVATR